MANLDDFVPFRMESLVRFPSCNKNCKTPSSIDECKCIPALALHWQIPERYVSKAALDIYHDVLNEHLLLDDEEGQTLCHMPTRLYQVFLIAVLKDMLPQIYDEMMDGFRDCTRGLILPGGMKRNKTYWEKIGEIPYNTNAKREAFVPITYLRKVLGDDPALLSAPTTSRYNKDCLSVGGIIDLCEELPALLRPRAIAIFGSVLKWCWEQTRAW